MSGFEEQPRNQDGTVDAIAAIAVITVVVSAVVFWLAGMPT